MPPDSMGRWAGDALISGDKVYRYWLARAAWRMGEANDRLITWLMLNPSTADHHTDDPTIRSVQRVSIEWGYRRFVVVNLFAYRATEPKVLATAVDPVGPANDQWIRHWAARSHLLVAAWGNSGGTALRERRIAEVSELLRRSSTPVVCLGTNKDGAPRHPLFPPARPVPIDYRTTS